jgi:hypothetical protein
MTQLERIGRALYGADWPAPFRARFEIGRRTFQRLTNGAQPLPAGLVRDIETELRDRGSLIDEILEELDAP